MAFAISASDIDFVVYDGGGLLSLAGRGRTKTHLEGHPV
jgi:hypothetical protein